MEENYKNTDLLYEANGTVIEIVTDFDDLTKSYFKLTDNNTVSRIKLLNGKYLTDVKANGTMLNVLYNFLTDDDYILDNNDKKIVQTKKWNKILFEMNTEYQFYLYINKQINNMMKYKTLYKNRNEKRLLSKGFLNIDLDMPDYRNINND